MQVLSPQRWSWIPRWNVPRPSSAQEHQTTAIFAVEDHLPKYPILTLPVEITTEIFLHYVGEQHDICRRDAGPLVLASVCTSWREICLSTSLLWASLRVAMGDSANRAWNDKTRFPLLKLWLSRAGNRPLDLSVFASKDTPWVLSYLSQYSSRWQSLEFEFHPASSSVLDALKGYLPSLTKLGISGPGAVMLTAFKEAPSLRQVSLSHASLKCISLPWTQLTHFTAGPGGSFGECVQILKETPNLEILEIQIFVDRGPPIEMPKLWVTLARLHTFAFRFGFGGIVLNHLSLPAVRHLDLSHLTTNGGVDRFITLGARSAWSPRSMAVAHMANEVAIPCLRSLPSLEEVKLTTGDHLPPLLELLTDEDHFLPALRSLTIRCEGSFNERFDKFVYALAAMLASRWRVERQGMVRLKSFHLTFVPTSKVFLTAGELKDIRTRVQTFIKEGMDLTIASK
ncbi:hypothetical protein K438DRAFT_1832465 [Mycena galopus ATCC 62051]|nr:hypothetical protein K438DRAFT_1832465 [Mycena galopus ATCC 62051]